MDTDNETNKPDDSAEPEANTLKDSPVETLEETQEPQEPAASDKTAAPTPHKSKKRLLISIAVLVLLLLIGGGLYMWTNKHDKTVPSIKSMSSVKPQTNNSTVMDRFIKPTTGETWLSAPKKLGDLDFLSNEVNKEYASYYEVGSHSGKTIIITVSRDGPGNPNISIFEKASDGNVTVLVKPDSKDQSQSIDYIVKPSISRDTTTHYDSLTPPDQFPVNSAETATVTQYSFFGEFTADSPATTGENTTVVKDYGPSKLVKIEHPYVDTNLTAISYAIETPIGTRAILDYKPLPEDLGDYTWNNGVMITSSGSNNDGSSKTPSSYISGIIRGCGSISSSVSKSVVATDSDFTEAGKTADGRAVYEFKDSSNVLIKKAYSEYADKDSSYLWTNGSPVTLKQFIDSHAVVAYKNAEGSWLVYTRDIYAPGGGCAKPVVYLYPTKTENVSVKVGADVKVSVPFYDPTSGWSGVLAKRNGQLMVNGQAYDSLFWEGPGNGFYPAITSGTVVRHDSVVATMRSQLAEQGMNQKETNDFVEYWQDKIPNKPYVRMAWFNTSQMNQLAPLSISPKPDTLIRVFLDMDGLDQPIVIPAQKLSSTPRVGFTVTEWGGLSHAKLY